MDRHLGAPNEQGWTLNAIAPVDAPSDPEDNDPDPYGMMAARKLTNNRPLLVRSIGVF